MLCFGLNDILVGTTTERDGSYQINFICGKTIPLHAWTGPEVSRRLRVLDFKTVGT